MPVLKTLGRKCKNVLKYSNEVFVLHHSPPLPGTKILKKNKKNKKKNTQGHKITVDPVAVQLYLKGQVAAKIKNTYFPLTNSAVYPFRLFWCKLLKGTVNREVCVPKTHEETSTAMSFPGNPDLVSQDCQVGV